MCETKGWGKKESSRPNSFLPVGVGGQGPLVDPYISSITSTAL